MGKVSSVLKFDESPAFKNKNTCPQSEDTSWKGLPQYHEHIQGLAFDKKKKDALEARCLLPDNPMDTQFIRRMEAPKGADLPQSLSHLHQEGDSENRISSVKDTFKCSRFLSFDN